MRRFLELRLDIAGVRWQDIDRAGFRYCHLQRGEEDKLTQVQNRSFASTWGYNPNTVEEIIYRINLSNCSPEDVVLAYDGDKPIGYCWTRITHQAATGKRKGQIFMLGVDPDYQGRGIGKGVLSMFFWSRYQSPLTALRFLHHYLPHPLQASLIKDLVINPRLRSHLPAAKDNPFIGG